MIKFIARVIFELNRHLKIQVSFAPPKYRII